MIGVPMPNPRDSIIANLNQLLEHYFGAGKQVQEIFQSGKTSAYMRRSIRNQGRR